jgi:hypothetical protein
VLLETLVHLETLENLGDLENLLILVLLVLLEPLEPLEHLSHLEPLVLLGPLSNPVDLGLLENQLHPETLEPLEVLYFYYLTNPEDLLCYQNYFG